MIQAEINGSKYDNMNEKMKMTPKRQRMILKAKEMTLKKAKMMIKRIKMVDRKGGQKILNDTPN